MSELKKIKINNVIQYRSQNRVLIKTFVGGDIATKTSVECFAYDMSFFVDVINKLLHSEVDSIFIEPVSIYHPDFFNDDLINF